MNVTLYINKAENNRLDKTSYLQEVISLDGYLRDSTSMLAPTITFELPMLEELALVDEDNEDIETPDDDVVIYGGSIYEFNYAYISEFNRYYYVSDIVVMRSTIYMVSLICDVLMSFKDSLLSLTAIIERNENQYNDLIDDDMMPFLMNENVSIITPTNLLSNPVVFNPTLKNKKNFVLSVVNTIYVSTLQNIESGVSGLPDIYSESFALAESHTTYLLNAEEVRHVSSACLNDDTLLTYVKSLIAFPFVPNTLLETAALKIGSTYIDGSQQTPHASDTIKKHISEYVKVLEFDFPTCNSFKDYPPYTRYELYIPYLGYIDLDAKLLSSHRLLLYYVPNYEDGNADVCLYDKSNYTMVYSGTCQLGVKLGLSATNNREITDQRNAIALNAGIGVVAGMLSAGVGIYKQSPTSVVGGVVSSAKAITNAINANAMLYERGQVAFSSGSSSMYARLTPHLRIRWKPSAFSVNSSAYRKAYGKPLQASKQLSTLSGFTIVQSIHLENLGAFKREKDEIERLLREGVIL